MQFVYGIELQSGEDEQLFYDWGVDIEYLESFSRDVKLGFDVFRASCVLYIEGDSGEQRRIEALFKDMTINPPALHLVFPDVDFTRNTYTKNRRRTAKQRNQLISTTTLLQRLRREQNLAQVLIEI